MNPVLPLNEFIPDVEAQVFTDSKGEKRLYLYGSHDNYPSDTWCSHQYRVYSAPLNDLSQWTDHGVSFASRKGEGYIWDGEDADGVSWTDCALYAPDVEFDGEFYWLVGCLAGGGLTISRSNVPEGPFSPAKQICYEDGTHLGSIDPSIFWDNGQMYLVWGQTCAFGSEGCVGAILEKDADGFYSIARSKTILMDGEGHNSDGFFFYEGPSLGKLDNGSYYIYYPSGHGTEVHAMSYATAEHPLGPYTYRGVVIDPAGTDNIAGNCHGSLCKINGQWYAFYHRGVNGDKSRRVCVEPIFIQEDGTIEQVPVTSRGFGGPLNPYERTDASYASRIRLPGFAFGCHFDIQDDDRHPLVHITDGCCAEYRDFDFGVNNGKLYLEADIWPEAGGNIEVVPDDPKAAPVAVLNIPAEGNGWQTFSTEVENIEGIHALYFRFRGAEGDLFQISSFKFVRQ